MTSTLAPDAVVFSPAAQWAGGVDRRLAFATEVMTAQNETEQRRWRRAIPQVQHSFRVAALEAQAAGVLDALLYQGPDVQWAVPYWPHECDVLAAVSAGSDVVVSCDPASCLFAVGGLAVLLRIRDHAAPVAELCDVTAVAGDAVTLGAVAGTWGPGDSILPAHLGRVTAEQTLERVTGRGNEVAVTFDLEGLTDPAVAQPALQVFELPRGPNADATAGGVPADGQARKVRRIATPTGGFADYPLSSTSRLTVTQPAELYSRAEVAALEQWYDGVRGAATRVWIPLYHYTLDVVDDLAAVDTTVRIRAVGFPATYLPREARRHLVVLLPDGTNRHRRVTDAVDNGDGTETLTLDAAIGVALPAAEAVLTFLLCARLAEDALTISWASSNVASAVLTFLELPGEMPAATTDPAEPPSGFDATEASQQGAAPVECYRITRGIPSPTIGVPIPIGDTTIPGSRVVPPGGFDHAWEKISGAEGWNNTVNHIAVSGTFGGVLHTTHVTPIDDGAGIDMEIVTGLAIGDAGAFCLVNYAGAGVLSPSTAFTLQVRFKVSPLLELPYHWTCSVNGADFFVGHQPPTAGDYYVVNIPFTTDASGDLAISMGLGDAEFPSGLYFCTFYGVRIFTNDGDTSGNPPDTGLGSGDRSFYTSADLPQVITDPAYAGTYVPALWERLELTVAAATGTLPELQVKIPRDHALAALYADGAVQPPMQVEVLYGHRTDLSQVDRLWWGDLVRRERQDDATVVFAFQHALAQLATLTPRRMLSLFCQNVNGDRVCRIDRNAFAYTAAVTVISDDGRTITVPGLRAFAVTKDPTSPDDYFTQGTLRDTSGLEWGIETQAPDDTVRLLLPADLAAVPALLVGDTITLFAGDDYTITTCNRKFLNIQNFTGEPTRPDRSFFEGSGLA